MKFLFQNFTRNNEKETSSENEVVTDEQSDLLNYLKANPTFSEETKNLELQFRLLEQLIN